MSKTKISEFSSDPALNTDIDGINIAEGCAPSGINNAIRELMAQLKDWQSGTSLDTFNTNYMIATAVDINGGAIDGATIGAASAAAGTFTTATATTVNSTTVDTTNLEVTNIKAKDGTAAGSIADSTGVVTLGSSVLTTTDINGGTIDNTAIGGATPAVGSFTQVNADNLRLDGNALTSTDTNGNIDLTPNGTGEVNISKVDIDSGSIDGTAIGASSASTGAFTTLSASSTVTLSGGTANGVAYLNGSKVLTTGSALTFDGTLLTLPRLGQSGSGTYGYFNTTGAGNGFLSFQYNSSEVGEIGQGSGIIAGGSNTDFGIRATNNLLFSISFNEQMRLTSTGLGIGTSSPNIAGVAKALTIDGSDALLEIANSGTVRATLYGNSSGAALSGIGSSGLRFFTSASGATSERMRLDSSGNLGLGVTPSAGTSGKVFQITDAGHFMASGSNIYIDANAYFDSGWKYITTAAASNYYQSSGAHIWNTAPSGTAGNAITFTQAMTLDASGNLLVGTTSSTYTASGRGVVEVGGGSTAIMALKVGGSGVGYTYHDGTAMSLWNVANGNLLFGTNNAERMRITSSGNVGIGTSSPSAKLDVMGSARIGAQGGVTFASDYENCLFIAGASTALADKKAVAALQLGDNVSGGSRQWAIANGANTLALLEFICSTAVNTNPLASGNTRMSLNSSGDLNIVGALSKGSGSFKIDHPLKSETHHLVHSFVEAPQADNIYRGKVSLVNGRAEVNIDTVASMTEGTFVALNREVQCFTSNESDWDAVRGSVLGNILTIECQNAESTATISWLVIGERQDQHMYDTDWTDENGKVIVEPLKPIET